MTRNWYPSSTMLLSISTFAKDVDILKKLLFKYEMKLLHKTFLPAVVNGDCLDKDVPL